MAVVIREASLQMADYVCDGCHEGSMAVCGKPKPGLQQGDVMVPHKCNKCGRLHDFKNMQYPSQRLVPGKILHDENEQEKPDEATNADSTTDTEPTQSDK